MASKFNSWIDHVDVHYNHAEECDNLWLWGRKHTGLIATITVDRSYYAMRFINQHKMECVYTVDASDGNKYDVYEDRGCHYRVAIPA